MKTILSLLLVALLILSAFPFAFANEEEATVNLYQDGDPVEAVDVSPPGPPVENEGLRRGGFVDRLRDREQRFKTRLQVAEKLRLEADKYRGDIKRIRADVRSCDKEMTEECKAARVAAQEHLLALADRVLSLLEQLETRVENSDMDAEVKAKMLADISAGKAEVQVVADEIVALGPDATREDYQQASKNIRTVWQKISKGLHLGALQLYTHRYESVIAKAQRADAKMQSMIERAEQSGSDTTALIAAQTSFNEHIADAKEALVSAQDAAREDDKERARTLLREAHDHLAQAHAALKEFMQEYRALVSVKAEA